MENILVVGGGSLGSVYASYLGLAGHDVQLLSRPAHAAAIEANGGIELVTPDGATQLAPVHAVLDPADLRPASYLILCTKAFDTDEALGSVAHLAAHLQAAFSVQNGLDNHGALARHLGERVAVPAVSMVGGTLERPGRVRATRHDPTFFGAGPGGDEPALALTELIETTSLHGRFVDDIRSVVWAKLAYAVPGMAVAALVRHATHELVLTPGWRSAFLALMRETLAIAKADGVRLQDWPSMFPVATLDGLDDSDADAVLEQHGRDMVAAGATAVRLSMLQSVEAGQRLELDAIHGAALTRARELNVDVPRIELAYSLLAGFNEVRTGSAP